MGKSGTHCAVPVDISDSTAVSIAHKKTPPRFKYLQGLSGTTNVALFYVSKVSKEN
jgi:hypothetical protein